MKGKGKRELFIYYFKHYAEYKPGDVVNKHNDMDCFGQAVSGNNRVCLISIFIIIIFNIFCSVYSDTQYVKPLTGQNLLLQLKVSDFV